MLRNILDHNPFKLKSLPNPIASNQLESVFSLIENDLHKCNPRPSRQKNRIGEQYKSLRNLKNNADIIIKHAHKGSTYGIMDRDDYIQESYSQLGNPLFYEETEMNLTGEVIHELNIHIHIDTRIK